MNEQTNECLNGPEGRLVLKKKFVFFLQNFVILVNQ